MPNQYASVRKQWREIDTKRDLAAIWRGERFESADAIGEALRVYELAIRVDGWETVKGWATAALTNEQMLNAQVVELAMRAIEQRDEAFFEEITSHLLKTSAPNYFRFWHTLFSARHANFGERIFRRHLAELSDYHIIKYRRWLKKTLRKLRYRCKTPKEKAIGAIAFAMYKQYDAKEYPSEVFNAYLACHDAARTPLKIKQSGKVVSKSKQMEHFAPLAAKLGIWSVTEGIRTSHRLPRTLTYLAAMAPAMSDRELLRGLRAFDANLSTAEHKKASEQVVQLAEYMTERLGRMDVKLEEWAKIYPYLKSPTLRHVFEQVIDARLEEQQQRLTDVECCPVVVMPETLQGRAHRSALLASYLLYLVEQRSSVFLVEVLPRVLSHPSSLWPYGYGVEPAAHRWQSNPDRRHRVLYQLVRETFVDAAQRRQSTAAATDGYLQSLRYHQHRRIELDGSASPDDVPVLFFPTEPSKEEHHGLLAHLSLFSGAVLVLFDERWKNELAGGNLVHLTVNTDLADALEALQDALKKLRPHRASFAQRMDAVNAELRHLRMGPRLELSHIRQGPYRLDR